MASKPKPPTDTLPDAARLDALRARIAELEAREAEHARAERVQAALYRIAEAASAASDLQAFYREVHATVGTLMSAENFYIALYDDQRKAINFPYYVDSVDLDIPDPNLWEPFGVGNARGITAYVLRTGRPAIINPERHPSSSAQGEIETSASSAKATGWGHPLKADGQTIGVVVCQTYEDVHYTDADRELLAFVGQHVGVRAEPRPGDRGDAPAERGAGAHQRDRRGARQAARLRGDRRAGRRADRDRSSTRKLDVRRALRPGDRTSIRSRTSVDEGERDRRRETARVRRRPDVEVIATGDRC